jgi:hypothetical protein
VDSLTKILHQNRAKCPILTQWVKRELWAEKP